MKIRNGFVSNSSSSSFLVLFPRKPENKDDVKDMIFYKGEIIYSSPYNDDVWSADEVAETVWNDIREQNPNNIDYAKEELRDGNIDDPEAPNYENFQKPGTNWDIDWEKYSEACDKFAEKKIKEFFNERKLKLKKLNNEDVEEKILYIFEYSDNDGSYYSALEHGNLFKHLKHIRISKH